VYACTNFGFFQVTGHGILPELIAKFCYQCALYFQAALDSKKEKWRRHQGNARGFVNDELTEQRHNWKQGFDVGVPGTRD
jgi:isopenicillin N synthase-like dioxygenase